MAGDGVSESDRSPGELPAIVLPSRYRPLARIVGKGSENAEVWVVHDTDGGRQVAVKILRSGENGTARARWIRELRIGLQFDHPNLLKTLDVLEIGEDLGAVMEWAPEGDLGRRLAFQGPQPVSAVALWTRQTLSALAFLHDQHLVHRDVKPSNLLLFDDQCVKLGDFGLVGSIGGPLLKSGLRVGTTDYMPPDQKNGVNPPEPWWDLFGLGVTAFQLLTGKLPEISDSEALWTRAALLGRPTRDVPWFAEVVERLLQTDPERRTSNAGEILAALERVP